MRKIFISVPMKDKTKEQIEKNIADIKEFCTKLFQKEQVEFVNTIVQEKPPYESGEHTSVWYLGKSLEKLSTCNMIVIENGVDYTKYSGCYIELETAKRYGIDVLAIDLGE